LGIVAAFGLWYVIFVRPEGVFWVKMALGSFILALASLAVMPRRARELLKPTPIDILLGIASSLLLWGIFWAGRQLLTAVLPGSADAIRSVYALRSEAAPWVIALLLLVLTGPAEEIFWRGLVQRVLAGRLGAVPGIAVASVVYSAVHVWTRNGPLVLAALVAGAFWGSFFVWRRSLVAPIVSHALWGVEVFVFLPLA